MRVIKIITGMITVIFIFSIIAFIASKFFVKTGYWQCRDGEWVQKGKPSMPMPNRDCLPEEANNFIKNNPKENNDTVDNKWPDKYVAGIQFSDNSSPLAFRFPLSWQDNYEEAIVEEESGTRRAKIYYLGEDENALLFLINIFPKSMDIDEIENMPNNRILGQNVNYYYSFSRALDIPYVEDSNDYSPYLKMVEEVDEVIDSIMLSSDYETHDIKIVENNGEENFMIDISYSRIVGPIFEHRFNDLMFGYIENVISEFKSEAVVLEIDEDVQKKLSILKLNYNFESVDVDNHIITINIYGFEKINENQDDINKTFKYDLKNDKELEI